MKIIKSLAAKILNKVLPPFIRLWSDGSGLTLKGNDDVYIWIGLQEFWTDDGDFKEHYCIIAHDGNNGAEHYDMTFSGLLEACQWILPTWRQYWSVM